MGIFQIIGEAKIDAASDHVKCAQKHLAVDREYKKYYLSRHVAKAEICNT